MPVQACKEGGKSGYRWGESGKCYTYPAGNEKARKEAKRKAVIQGIAAGERPSAAKFNAAISASYAVAERTHLPALERAYEHAIREAARPASALTAAPDWQPPPEGALFTVAELAALSASLNEKLAPIWTRIVLDAANRPLATIEISFDVSHPIPVRLLEQAAKRTGARLGEAVQFILRDTIARAYADGLPVESAAALIRAQITAAAPWQAEMLARTDLNSLANGASKAAAAEVGMGFKTWLATLDDKTRPEHVDAHGQTVPMNDTFLVGGEDADYPGDPALSDAMAANCRCTSAYSETLEEANGLLAAGLPADEGSIIMGAVASRRERMKRKAARHAGKEEAVVTPTALVAAPRSIRFAGVAAIEGILSDDSSLTPRALLPDSLDWPEMPQSFYAQTKTDEGHMGAEIAGRVDSYSRKRGKGREREISIDGEFTNEFGVLTIAPMVEDGTMRFVSVDLGAIEWSIIRRETFEPVSNEDLSLDELNANQYALGIIKGKIKATTLVGTQALPGSSIALVASADGTEATLTFPVEFTMVGEGEALVASPAPRDPPREWFETQEPPGEMPLTITKEGRVYGHLATWNSCHASFLPQCVPPPRSPSNYARFHTSYLDTAEGDEITVGKLMFSPTDGGHADRRLSAAKASAYYDKTGMAGAYLRAVDGQYGIWVAGALNPKMTDEQREEMRRELRLNPPSGDWRPYDGQYDLLCGLAVAVPGFGVVPSAEVSIIASADGVELQDAIIASSGLIEPAPAAVAALEKQGLIDEDLVAERQMRALVARSEGIGALAALVE